MARSRHPAKPLLPAMLVLGASSLLLSDLAAAAAYRWTDASGGVHYSQVPPSNRPYQLVSGNGVPGPQQTAEAASTAEDNTPVTGAANSPPLSENQAFLKRAAEAEAKKQKQAQADKTAQAAARQQCETARSRLRFLDEHPPNRLMQRDASGVPSRVTSEQWDAQRAAANKLIADNCR